MSSARFRLLLAGLVPVWLSGCAGLETGRPLDIATAPGWERHQSQLAAIRSWDLQGRLALRTGDEGWQLNLRWRQDRSNHQIDLSGPFGQGRVQLSQDSTGAVLRDENQQTYYASDAEQLLYDITGWRVPVDHLVYWVRGMPVPGERRRLRVDAQGRTRSLTQGRWRIEILGYRQVGRVQLPNRLFMTYQQVIGDPDAGVTEVLNQVELRLAISRWSVNGE